MKPTHLSKRGLPPHHRGAAEHSPKRCAICAGAHGRNKRQKWWIMVGDYSSVPAWVKSGTRAEANRNAINGFPALGEP